MSKCDHCDEPLGNRMVVMEDNSIYCYTCGRLEADYHCRSPEILYKTREAFLERRAVGS